ncbi:ArnT family glycosyltransferase [Gimesia chilikensis]|uniref:ArnT family glycosyltransferase n=1 Tax=Gimesia chilikensis TaxID=2605989 RepID=UPI00165905D1|nr:glycosyltransferase family 39 protein [Gimesia chilikensis]
MTEDQARPSVNFGVLFFVWVTPLLLAAYILETNFAVRISKSPTYDETHYLSTALTTVHQGALDSRISGEGVAPLPILVDYLPVVWSTGGKARPDVWEADVSDPRLIQRARFINVLVIGIPTMLLVYCWLYRRRGYLAALLGGCLVTFSPTLIAHFSLATTDAFFTLLALIALAVMTRYWKQPTTLNLCWLALSVSVATSAKYSGIFLLPCTLIVMVLIALQKWTTFSRTAVWTLTKRVTLVFSLFLLLLVPLTWACHLFSFTGPLKTVPYAETPDYSAWVRVLGRGPTAQKIMEVAHNDLKRPAPFAGILFQFLHNTAGHEAYLLGEVSKTGWWYYFPLAWLWKSTPIELLLTLLCLLLIPWLWRDVKPLLRPAEGEEGDLTSIGRQQSNTPTSHAPLIWLMAALVLLGMSLTSRLNLGQRYLLTLYPLLYLFTIDQLWRWFQERRVWLWVFSAICIGFQCASISSIQPHYLAYFNDSVGGPSNGHLYLLDSNLDWGQDLPAVKKALDELPAEDRDKCLLYYFGTALPESYGIKGFDLKESLPENPADWKYLILSVNHLQGFYTQVEDPFAAFRKITPLKRAGYSIYIYDLQSPEARQALQEALKKLKSYHDAQEEGAVTENGSAAVSEPSQ